MPPRLTRNSLTPGDRRLLWGAAACTLVLCAGIAATSPDLKYPPVPSIYSTGSGGARAAYLLLRDLHFDVRAWEEAPAGLNVAAPGALLILAEPSEQPSAGDVAALRRFVDQGGRVLFCGASAADFFPEAKVSSPVPGIEWKEFSARMPSAISRGADRVIMQPRVYWGTPGASQVPLYGSEEGAAVVSWSMGKGEVLWWAGATPLTNAGIAKAGNLNLFLNSVSDSAGEPLSIYWDEYFHGQRASLLSYVEKTPVVWAAAQILLIAAIVLVTFSRRSGPIVMPAGVSRLSPLEFVDTMGALYQHAGASAIPVEVSYRHLRLELTRRLGIPPATADADLAGVAAERLHFNRAALADILNRARQAEYAPRQRAGESLAIVQSLAEFTARIVMPQAFLPKTNEEKDGSWKISTR